MRKMSLVVPVGVMFQVESDFQRATMEATTERMHAMSNTFLVSYHFFNTILSSLFFSSSSSSACCMLPINTCSRAFFINKRYQFAPFFLRTKNQIRVRIIRRSKKNIKKKTRPLCHHIKERVLVCFRFNHSACSSRERERVKE